MCIKVTRLFKKRTFENREVDDSEGKLATRPEEIYKNIVSALFRDKFEDKN